MQSGQAASIKPQESEEPRTSLLSPHALGNLALREIETGELDSARRHIEAALELYRRDGDVSGESRCHSNLATLHISLEEWPQAVLATRKALALREQAGDLDGQILILSNLANLLLKTGEAAEAVEAARACLELAPQDRRSWPLASAKAALAQALCQLRRWGDARVALSAAMEALRAVEHPDRDRVISQLKGLASLLAEVEGEVRSHFDISPAAMPAMAAAKAGNTPEAIAQALGELARDAALAGVDRATIMGEYGNALVEIESFAEADTTYREALQLYEDAGQAGMVWHTKVIMAFALLHAGKVDDAETLMSTILQDCPIAKVRANLLTGYAKLVFMHRLDDKAAVESLRNKLRGAVAVAGVDAETLGRAQVQLAQCEWILDDPEAEKAMLRQAKALLVRSNSKLLPEIAKLEAAYEDSPR
ncbi:MAG: tetratricopeptide repeat protein [Methylocella sp.]